MAIVVPVITATNATSSDSTLDTNSFIPTISSPMTPIGLADAAARMLQLAILAEQKRQSVPLLYNNRPERISLERELNSCLMAAPLHGSYFVSDKLATIKQALSETSGPIGLDTQQAALLALAYHTAFCILCSPPDGHIWTKQLTASWVKSASFVEANDHAIKSTQILIPLLDAPELPDVGRFVEFQWCVLRTGLSHQAFLYAAEMAGERGRGLAAEAQTYIALHSAALLRAHEVNGIVGTPWWIDEWPARNDELSIHREGSGFWGQLDFR